MCQQQVDIVVPELPEIVECAFLCNTGSTDNSQRLVGHHSLVLRHMCTQATLGLVCSVYSTLSPSFPSYTGNIVPKRASVGRMPHCGMWAAAIVLAATLLAQICSADSIHTREAATHPTRSAASYNTGHIQHAVDNSSKLHQSNSYAWASSTSTKWDLYQGRWQEQRQQQHRQLCASATDAHLHMPE